MVVLVLCPDPAVASRILAIKSAFDNFEKFGIFSYSSIDVLSKRDDTDLFTSRLEIWDFE